jgi:hypothetical protein
MPSSAATAMATVLFRKSLRCMWSSLLTRGSVALQNKLDLPICHHFKAVGNLLFISFYYACPAILFEERFQAGKDISSIFPTNSRCWPF